MKVRALGAISIVRITGLALAASLGASLSSPSESAAAAAQDRSSAGAGAGIIRFSWTIPVADHGGAPLALSGDQKYLATTDGHRIRIFLIDGVIDVDPLRELASLQRPKWYSQLIFSPDGSSLAGAGGGATIWSTQDWRARWTAPAGESIYTLAYSPDGRTLYLAGSSAFFEALDAADGTVRWKQPALSTATSRIAISTDGKVAAVGSYGGGLRLISTGDGTVLALLADSRGYGGKTTAAQRAGWVAHPGAIEALAFSSDGSRLASAGGDGTIKLWDVRARSLLWANVCGTTTLTLAFEVPRSASNAKSDAVLAAGCGSTVRRVDVQTGKTLPSLHGHGRDVTAVVAEPDGRGLWSAAGDGTLKRWDLRRLRETVTYGAIEDAALSADGKTLAFARGDDAIVLRAVGDGRTLATLRGNVLPQVTEDHSYARAALAISSDGEYVAAGGYVTQGFIDHQGVAKSVTRVWNRTRTQPLHVWDGVAPDLIAFAPDQRHIVARSPAMTDTKDTTWILQIQSSAVTPWIAQWSKHEGEYYYDCKLVGFDRAGVVFPNDSKNAGGRAMLLVVTDAGACPSPYVANRPLRLWPLGSRTAGPPFAGPRLGQRAALALSADGRTAVTYDGWTIASGFDSKPGELGVWDVAAQKIRLRGPPTTALDDRWCEMTEFAAGGNLAVGLILIDSTRTGWRDRYELVAWDLTSGKIVARTNRYRAVEYSHLLLRADGKRAYVTTPAGIDVWILETARSTR